MVAKIYDLAYTRHLMEKIKNSPDHTLSLQDAIEYMKFYGLRNLISAQGNVRFVGQAAIDAFDKALESNKCVISWDDTEGTIAAEAMQIKE